MQRGMFSEAVEDHWLTYQGSILQLLARNKAWKWPEKAENHLSEVY